MPTACRLTEQVTQRLGQQGGGPRPPNPHCWDPGSPAAGGLTTCFRCGPRPPARGAVGELCSVLASPRRGPCGGSSARGPGPAGSGESASPPRSFSVDGTSLHAGDPAPASRACVLGHRPSVSAILRTRQTHRVGPSARPASERVLNSRWSHGRQHARAGWTPNSCSVSTDRSRDVWRSVFGVGGIPVTQGEAQPPGHSLGAFGQNV